MDLRRLRYFVAVAEELSFNRAAQRLRISQPPLSNQIKQLEEELDVLLFVRTNRGVRMTEAGEALLEEARRILVQLEQTTRLVQRVGHGEVGRLTLGFVPSASNEVLPPILRTFRNRFPDVELFLREMRPDQVVSAAARQADRCGVSVPPARRCLAQHRMRLARASGSCPAGVASSRRKTASRATSPRRRAVHPSRALFDARSLRTGYSGLPARRVSFRGRYRKTSGSCRP